MGAFLRDSRGARQFGIEMSICRAQRVDDLIGIIMGNDRDRFLFAIRSLEIVVRNRPDWFECTFLDRDSRDWFANHFRHLLLTDLRDWFGNHFWHLLHGDRRFFLRDYLRRRFLRDYLRGFPGDHLNRIFLYCLFALG